VNIQLRENEGSDKILKEAFWQNQLEAEANSEATNFIQSWKRKQKIPRVKKRKRTQKHDTLREAESSSQKYSTASTPVVVINNSDMKW